MFLVNLLKNGGIMKEATLSFLYRTLYSALEINALECTLKCSSGQVWESINRCEAPTPNDVCSDEVVMYAVRYSVDRVEQ